MRLTSVSCPAADFCAAADYNGDVLTYDGHSWSSPERLVAHGYLAAVSCVSSSFCAAAGGTSGNDYAFTYDGSTWGSPTAIDNPRGYGVFAVECASTSLCFATEGTDVSTFNGSSWSAPSLMDAAAAGGDRGVDSISCPSTGFCMAVDDNGHALSYNGQSWSSPVKVDPSSNASWGGGNDLWSVSCPTSSFCIALDPGGADLIYQGGSWSKPMALESFGIDLEAVSCASPSLCFAVDDKGRAFRYPRTTPPPPNGDSWSEPSHFVLVPGTRSELMSSAILESKAGHAKGGYVFKSPDGGETWTLARIPTEYAGGNPGQGIGGGVGGDLLPIGTDGVLLSIPHRNSGTPIHRVDRSLDGGKTWTTVVGHIGWGRAMIWGASLTGDPSDPHAAWLCTTGAGIFQTRNDGATWRRVPGAPRSYPTLSVETHGRVLIVTTYNVQADEAGPAFRSSNDGRTWQRISLPNSPLVVSFSSSQPKLVVAVTAYQTASGGRLQIGNEFWRSIDAGKHWKLGARLPDSKWIGDGLTVGAMSGGRRFVSGPWQEMRNGSSRSRWAYFTSTDGLHWKPSVIVRAYARVVYPAVGLLSEVVATNGGAGPVYALKPGARRWTRIGHMPPPP
jgi:hypothetical protein